MEAPGLPIRLNRKTPGKPADDRTSLSAPDKKRDTD